MERACLAVRRALLSIFRGLGMATVGSKGDLARWLVTMCKQVRIFFLHFRISRIPDAMLYAKGSDERMPEDNHVHG